MAASCELRGELKYKDGLKKTVRIETEKNFPSILTGIKKLNADVSEMLSELVAQEKLGGAREMQMLEADNDAEDVGDEDDGEEEMEETKTSVSEPPLKKSKPLRT